MITEAGIEDGRAAGAEEPAAFDLGVGNAESAEGNAEVAEKGQVEGEGRRARNRWIGERLEWARGVARVQGWDPKWVRNLSDVAAVEHGCWFSEDSAEDVCEFIALFCRHYKGSLAGEPFELSGWQRERIVKPIFGWLRPDGTRRIRTAYVEVPRKNGKSTLAAAIAIYLLVADCQMGASVVSAASTREQARVVFRSACQMVRLSEELKRLLKVYRDSIVWEDTASTYVVISADAGPQHGRDDSGVVFDELHAQPDAELWKVLRSGTGSRTEPLVFVITTSGDTKEHICFEQHERVRKIDENEIVDDAYYGYIAAADERDDWWRLETIVKANPALELDDWVEYGEADESGYRRVKLSGACPFQFEVRSSEFEVGGGGTLGSERGDSHVAPRYRGTPQNDSVGWDGAAIERYVAELTRFVRRHPEYGVGAVRLDNLVDELREAVDSSTARAAWKWLHLDLWEQATYGWMEGWRWDRCGFPVDRASLKGRRCFGGLDLASKIDMTAFVLVFPPDRGSEKAGTATHFRTAENGLAVPVFSRWEVLCWYWVPEETAGERARKDKVPYLEWIQDGWLKTTRGSVADYDEIGRDLEGLRKEFKVEQIAFDPWNAGMLATQLGTYGYTMVESPQTIRWMSDAMKEIEAKVISEQLAHGGHPILRWNALNVVAKLNANEDVRPDKARSREKIDGLVALIMAMGRAILVAPKKGSKYGTGYEPEAM